MKVFVVVSIILIVGAGGFIGGKYYGEKVQKQKTQTKTTSATMSPVAVTSATAAKGTSPIAGQTIAQRTAAANTNGIKVMAPVADATITSPLNITGEAVGSWYFEGEFAIVMTDANGAEVAQTIAKASSDWMTESYVPFTATITFKKQLTPFGYLIFRKSNPSGQPSNDQEYKVRVYF